MTDFTHHSALPFDAVEPPQSQTFKPLQDTAYLTGLVLLVLSVGIFLFPSGEIRPDFLGQTMIHYVIAIGYMLYLATQKRVRWWLFGARREHYPTMLLALLLWMVSCFALNRTIPVFKPSAVWLQVHLVVSAAACIAYAWRERMSPPSRMLLGFVLGATLLLFAYYAVSTLPLFFLGLVAFWFFGLPLHGVIASVFSLYLILVIRNEMRESRYLRWSAYAGLALPAVAVLLFAGRWFMLNQEVVNSLQEVRANGDQSLPHWVAVSQHLRSTPTTGKMLKAIADGTVRNRNRGPLEWAFLMDDNADHNDPFLQVAGSIAPVPDLSRDDCARIYTSLYDPRHSAEERLWSGNDLETKTVETRALLDPGHRLAYTEKTLTVGHKAFKEQRGPDTQEAIYTFFLPEGGVVTSLSLWVNGVEQPARLTSKSKAKAAYTAIVGRERRDPAVVHWQEGNTVQVRVFPVTTAEPRRFKIGITSPLQLEGEHLNYGNITFDGPPALLASEDDSLFLEGNARLSDVPLFFEKTKSGAATYDGRYRHGWSATCDLPPLAHSVFSFDGKTYQAQPYTPETETFQPEKIYLDLNQSWSTSEWKALLRMLKGRAVYVPTPTGFEALTEEKTGPLFRKAQQLRYSLFPFHRLVKPETALVISKSAHPTPRPADLEESDFRTGLEALTSAKPIRVFHLGRDAESAGDLSAYLRSLAEARSIFCTPGSLSDLEKALAENRFRKKPEDEHTVALPAAGMLLTEVDSPQQSEAPSSASPTRDGMFRLFAYNRIMQALGSRREEQDDLVELAEQANVVTPVSSLVTLETQADYERFGIKPTEGLNALGNASLGNSGSVPEPHEWALIVLMLLAGAWAWRRRMF